MTTSPRDDQREKAPSEPLAPVSGAGPDGPPPTAPEAAERPAPPRAGDDPLRGSRTGGVWAALVAFGIVLVLLVVFIFQNTETAQVAYFGWEGSAPLAVLLLVATAAGILLTAAAGTLRILQLRRRVRRVEKQTRKA